MTFTCYKALFSDGTVAMLSTEARFTHAWLAAGYRLLPPDGWRQNWSAGPGWSSSETNAHMRATAQLKEIGGTVTFYEVVPTIVISAREYRQLSKYKDELVRRRRKGERVAGASVVGPPRF